MPRRAPISDEETSAPPVKRVRRAPRKRVVDEGEISEGAARDATERVEEGGEAAPLRPRRKAPTRRVPEPAAADSAPEAPVTNRPRPARSRVPTFIMVAVFLGAIGVSAALGFSDKGTIDVAAKLQEQGQIQANIASEQAGVPNQVVPVQNTPVAVPNGGLSGRGVDSAPTPPPPVEIASTTASSTEEVTATTTDTADEDVSNEAEAVGTEAAEAPEEAATPVQ